MKKCKTCKHWKVEKFGMGKCTGIFGEGFLIPIPNQPKGKKNGKLVSTEGIIATCPFVTTTENWKEEKKTGRESFLGPVIISV